MTQKMIHLGSVLLLAVLLATLAPAAKAQIMPSPCCPITAIDARTGVVSAKVNASGATFQFKVTDPLLLKSLKVGQEVYANFTTKQVSLDGKRMLGEIVSPPQAAAPQAGPITAPKFAPPPPASAPVGKPATGAPAAAALPAPQQALTPTVATPSAQPAGPARTPVATSAAAPLAAGEIQKKLVPAAPNCTITAISATTDVVTAKENTTSKVFQFKLNDATQLNSLKIDQGVYANFAANVVSMNGLSPDGTILNVAAAPAASTSSASTSSAASAATAPAARPASAIKAPTTAVTPALINGKPWYLEQSFQLCCTYGTAGVIGPNSPTSGPTYWPASINSQLVPNPTNAIEFYITPIPGFAGWTTANTAPYVAHPLYVNFWTRQASIDGVTACCTISALSGVPIHYTEPVYLDMLPIGVIYVPPGDPHATGGSVPSQAFTQTNSSQTSTTTITSTVTGQTTSWKATIAGTGATGSSGSSTQQSTQLQQATSHSFMQGNQANGPGGSPGQDVIWVYVNPTFDVTYLGAYSYSNKIPPIPVAPEIISVSTHNAQPGEPGYPQKQWENCSVLVFELQTKGAQAPCVKDILPAPPQAPVPVNPIAKTVGVVKQSLTPAQRLLQLDPMVPFTPVNGLGLYPVAASALPSLTGSNGSQGAALPPVFNNPRFTPIGGQGNGAISWNYCQDPGPKKFNAAKSQTSGSQYSAVTKFTSSTTFTLDPVAAASDIAKGVVPAGSSGSVSFGDSWEFDTGVTTAAQDTTTLNTTITFGGGMTPSLSAPDNTWAPNTAYPNINPNISNGSYVLSTVDNTFEYALKTAGTSGLTEPAWCTTTGCTVKDGTVVWILYGPTCASLPGFLTSLFYDQLSDTVLFWTTPDTNTTRMARVASPPTGKRGIAGAPAASASAAPVTAPKVAPPPPASAPVANTAPTAAPMAAGAIQNKLGPNCTITAINTTTGVVAATENATAKTFEFKLNDITQLKSLNVGKGVYANFGAGQVSFDGITPGGIILSTPAAPAASTSSAATSPAASAATAGAPANGGVSISSSGQVPQGLNQIAQPGLGKPGVTLPQLVGGTVQIDPCTIASADLLKSLFQSGIQSYFPIAVNNSGKHISISSPNIEQVTCPHMAMKVHAAFEYRETRGFPQYQTGGSMELQSPLVVEVTLGGLEIANAPTPPSNVVRAVAKLTNPQITSLQVTNIPSWIDVTWIADCLNGKYSNWGCTDVLHAITFDVTALVRLYLQQGHTLPGGSASGAPTVLPPTLRDEKMTKPTPTTQQSSSSGNSNQRNNLGNEDSSAISARRRSKETNDRHDRDREHHLYSMRPAGLQVLHLSRT